MEARRSLASVADVTDLACASKRLAGLSELLCRAPSGLDLHGDR